MEIFLTKKVLLYYIFTLFCENSCHFFENYFFYHIKYQLSVKYAIFLQKNVYKLIDVVIIIYRKVVFKMKDSIRLNCRISKNKQLKILEEHYDGTLDSILFPTLSGEITGFSIFMVVNFAYYKDIIELILQVKERYEYIFDKQMHYFSRKQKDYINKILNI